MTVNPAQDVQNTETQTAPSNDKEYNFAKMRQQLEQERNEKARLQQEVDEIKKKLNQPVHQDDDDDDDEPYVDRRKLDKKLAKFGQQAKQETESVVQQEVRKALAEERRTNWLKSNPDFYEVMNHAQKFAEKDPDLAETILEMPDGFERQKLVYKNIKALGLHKKEEAKPSIQETIERNQRGPYYQPSGMGAPPYGIVSSGKNYSTSEMKNAYDKLQQLKSNLRI